jgi:hypothetical protein
MLNRFIEAMSRLMMAQVGACRYGKGPCEKRQ